jgi:hypothetical protein
MRRALVITIATLAAALLAIALACGSNPITIATIVGDAGHNTKCVVPDAGDGGETDDAGQFCSRNSCASKDGMNEPIDSPDCGASGPECGCDSITYYNRCLRQEARVSIAGQGPCLGQMGVSPKPCRDAKDCPNPNASCAFVVYVQFQPPDGGLSPMEQAACRALAEQGLGQAGGVCWSLPGSPPAGARLVQAAFCPEGCLDDWTAIRRGGSYNLCAQPEPDASLHASVH